MVIPESQVGRYGCHVTRVRPPDERAPCCGPRCAAWTRTHSAGQTVSAFDGRNRLIALVDLGRCALLPASLGGEHDDVVVAELRARRDELVAAGVLREEPITRTSSIFDRWPNAARAAEPAAADDIF